MRGVKSIGAFFLLACSVLTITAIESNAQMDQTLLEPSIQQSNRLDRYLDGALKLCVTTAICSLIGFVAEDLCKLDINNADSLAAQSYVDALTGIATTGASLALKDFGVPYGYVCADISSSLPSVIYVVRNKSMVRQLPYIPIRILFTAVLNAIVAWEKRRDPSMKNTCC